MIRELAPAPGDNPGEVVHWGHVYGHAEGDYGVSPFGQIPVIKLSLMSSAKSPLQRVSVLLTEEAARQVEAYIRGYFSLKR